MNRLLYLIIGLLSWNCSFADQFQIPTEQEAYKTFWLKIYPAGGWTLYCGDHFENKSNLSTEKIYAIEWVLDHYGCASLEICRKESARFNRIESDLHNYYPALNMITAARGGFQFGEVSGEFREFFECDFERDIRERIIEPRSIARGNIARAMFYMHQVYELPIEPAVATMLKQWNRDDPPSEDEIRRNGLIKKAQGTRNEFIDNPSLADKLDF